MRVDTFQYLIQELESYPGYTKNWTNGLKPLTVEKRILISLLYMATQMSLRKIGDQFNIADSTVLKAVDEFCDVLWNIRFKYIKWPTEEECAIIESQFKNLAQFSGNNSHI